MLKVNQSGISFSFSYMWSISVQKEKRLANQEAFVFLERFICTNVSCPLIMSKCLFILIKSFRDNVHDTYICLPLCSIALESRMSQGQSNSYFTKQLNTLLFGYEKLWQTHSITAVSQLWLYEQIHSWHISSRYFLAIIQ